MRSHGSSNGSSNGYGARVQPFDANASNWGIDDSSSLMVCVGAPADQPLCAHTGDSYRGKMWHPAPVTLAATPLSVSVDLSGLAVASGETVLAVRYGWALNKNNGDTCCPQRAPMEGLSVCVPGSCPIVSSRSLLPANPFYATVEAGKCKCMAPQTRDA